MSGSRGRCPSVVGQRCGALPAHTRLSEFLSFATDVRGKAAPELRYTFEYGQSCMQAFGGSRDAEPTLAIADGDHPYDSPSSAPQAVADQKQFFQEVDAYTETAGQTVQVPRQRTRRSRRPPKVGASSGM